MRARRRGTLIIGGSAFAAAGTAIGAASPASAASFEVTNLDDSGVGSLRQAIIDANGAAGADVITFQAGLTGTITLTTGQLSISDSVDIQGPGQTVITISGNDASRVFYLYANAATIDVSISGLTVTHGAASIGAGVVNFDERLTLDHVTITDNHASGDGGGLWADGFNQVLTVQETTISGNTSGDDGGGVYIEDTGGLTLFDRAAITGNTATGAGGGIYLYDPDDDVTFVNTTISGNTAGTKGGGVYLYSADSGSMLFDRTTISGNTAPIGGGAYLYGVDHPTTFLSSTISGNSSTAGQGGGLFLYVASTNDLVLAETTIAGNTSALAGGGLFLQFGDLRLTNDLIGDNSSSSTTDHDLGVGSGVVNADYTFVEDPGSVTLSGSNNVTSADAQLGPLQNNGGLTETQAPALTSPAVDHGDPAFVSPPNGDQRGSTRVVNGVIDMGSVEVVGPPVTDGYVTAEDTPLSVVAPGVLTNDPDAAHLIAALDAQAVNGVAVVNPDGSFTYTPNADYYGPDSFSYVTTGPIGVTGTAVVNIDVTPVNDDPVPVDDVAEAVPGAGPVQIQVLANDVDPDGDPLTVTAVTQGAQGTVTFSGNTITYTPNAGATGTDTFTYDFTDGVVTRTATVLVTLAAAPTTTAAQTTAAPTTAQAETTTTTPPATAPTLLPPTIEELPATGSGTNGSTELALTLLGTGVALTAASRRRSVRRSRQPS